MDNMTESTKRRKGESRVWEHFLKKEIGNGISRAQCKYCLKNYACDSGKNGTSNLHRHLTKCSKFLASLDEKQKRIFFNKLEIEGEGSTSSNAMTLRVYNEERCRRKLATMIVMEELPFSLVESKWLLDLFNEMQPKFNVPSRKTVANDIFKMYVGESDKLEVFFGEMTSTASISLTTDTWTSIQNVNYMVVTAHFIDKSWILQKKIINFCIIPDHKGETIATIIDKCLSEWKIHKVLTLTVDNASAHDSALNHVVDKMKQRRPLVLNGEFMHIRCFAHIINLVVTSGLNDHNDSIVKIQRAVKYVRSSPARMQKFRVCVESAEITCKNNVCLDVSTRWNSTYLMLQTAIKFEKAFDKLRECDIGYMAEFAKAGSLTDPSGEEDWRVAREIISLLKVFYEVTLKVSSTLRITANIFFAELCKLHLIIKKYVVSENAFLKTTALKMQLKFEKYWGDYSKVNHLMYVAVVVDPRFKIKFVRHCLLKLHTIKMTDEIITALEGTIRLLYADYKDHFPRPINLEEDDDCMPMVEDFEVENTFKAELDNEKEFGGEGTDEYDRYIAAKLEHFTDDGDLLQWWKMHTSDYPILSAIARDVLAIPISTVASESAFSCGSRVLDPFRSALSPKTVESLICLQSWIRDADIRENIYESIEEVTEIETDLLNMIAASKIT